MNHMRKIIIVYSPLMMLAVLFVINFVAGLIRGKIDEGYMLAIDSASRKQGERWMLFEPVVHNYWIGSIGQVRQLREDNKLFEIKAARYLNILPDVVYEPRHIGRAWIGTREDAPKRQTK